MKRWWRLLLNVAAGVSLVLCLGVVAIGVRSYFVGDSIYRSRWQVNESRAEERAVWTVFGRGDMLVGHRYQTFNRRPGDAAVIEQTTGPVDSWRQSRPGPPIIGQPGGRAYPLGFRYLWVPMPPEFGGPANFYREWVGPMWPFVIVLAALPGWVGWRIARRWARRRGPGCCARCGYDLRATPGRCPECGAAADGGS